MGKRGFILFGFSPMKMLAILPARVREPFLLIETVTINANTIQQE